MSAVRSMRRSREGSWLFFGACGMVFASSVVLWISLYNNTVETLHEIEIKEKETASLQVKNAELKNALFAKIDNGILESLARARGLVKVTAPKYFESYEQWASASQY